MGVRILVALLFVAVSLGLPMASAQTVTEQVTFIVPSDIPVQSGNIGDIAIFTGRPLGLVESAGACNGGTGFPLQNVVFIHSRQGAVTASVILIQFDSIPAGTRLESIQLLESCSGPDGSPYNKYQADVQHRGDGQ